MRALCRGQGLFGAEEGCGKAVEAEPSEELADEVGCRVYGPSYGGVMAFAVYVVFAFADVYGGRASEAGDAVPGVEVEPDIADLQCNHYRDS